jgi:tetratricopeptide (TPR) repeat protein
MPAIQEQYDDAMYEFSTADYDSAIARLKAVLSEAPDHFDARLALGMAYYRKGDYAAAIEEGIKAQKLKPDEQLVHTNLSLFYMKSGDKKTAEHHGLQARIASWKGNMTPPDAATKDDPELKIARPTPQPVKVERKFPEMPWKKQPPVKQSPPPNTIETL